MTFAERKAWRVGLEARQAAALAHMSVAGRMELLDEWLAGPALVDESGEPTGERGAPLITRETYLRLLKP